MVVVVFVSMQSHVLLYWSGVVGCHCGCRDRYGYYGSVNVVVCDELGAVEECKFVVLRRLYERVVRRHPFDGVRRRLAKFLQWKTCRV